MLPKNSLCCTRATSLGLYIVPNIADKNHAMIWIAIAALAALPHYVRDVINRGIGTYNASLAVADATVPHCSPNYYWNTENATTRPSLLYAYFVVCVNNEDIGWQYAAHIPKIGPVDIFNPNVTVFELLSVDNVPAAMICSCNFRLLATTLSFDAATDTIDASDALVWERSIKFSASDAAIKCLEVSWRRWSGPSAIVRVDSVQIYNMGPMHTAVYTPKEPNVQFSYILAWNAAESQSIQTDLVDVKEYEQPSTPDPIKPSQTLWFFLAGTVLTIFKKNHKLACHSVVPDISFIRTTRAPKAGNSFYYCGRIH